MNIKLRDIHAAGMCSKGAKKWLRHYGFDVMKFLSDGISAEEVESTGDALGKRVVKAKQEAEHGR